MDDAASAHPFAFDWGIHRPDGWRTFLLIALAYAACVGVSLLPLRYVCRRRRMLVSVSGVMSLIPMSGLAVQSVVVQLMAGDYRETHALAVAVVGAALLGVVCVGAFAASVRPRV